MRGRHFAIVPVVLVGIMVQVGCSDAGKTSSDDSMKKGEQSAKSAMPPGMAPEGGDMSKMYKGGSGQGGPPSGADPSKMYKQGGYPGGGQGGGGPPQPTTPGK